MADEQVEQKPKEKPAPTSERGELPPEQVKQVQDWLQARAPQYACSVCHHESWYPPAHIIRLTVQGYPLGGLGYPCVPLVFTTCGHTVLFNAVLMGLVPSVDQQQGAGKPNA